MGVFKEFLPVIGLGGGIAGAFSFLKGVIASTDTTADKFEATMSGLKEAFKVFKQSLATLDFTNLISGLRDAYKEGKNYADQLDLIADLQRALNIQKIDYEIEISRQRAVARNRSLDLKDREAAVAEIIRLEKLKLTETQKLADMELDAEARLYTSRDKTGKLNKELIVDFISNYSKYTDKIEEGIRLQEELDKVSQKFEPDAVTGYGTWSKDLKVYNEEYNKLTEAQKENIVIAKMTNLLNDEQRDKFGKVISTSKQAALELANSEESLVRLQNSLYNELIKDGDSADKALEKVQQLMDMLSGLGNVDFSKLVPEDLSTLFDQFINLPQFGDEIPFLYPDEQTVEDQTMYLMEKYQETVDGRLAINKAMYDAGLISETEYNDRKKALYEEDAANQKIINDKKLQDVQTYVGTAQSLTDSLMKFSIAAMNRELKAAGDNEQKKEEIQKKYAKQQKSIAIIQAIINTALGVTAALTQMPPASYIFAALTAIAGAAEIAVISSQQFASGRYPVMGATDGQMYNAQYVGAPRTGIQRGPALVSERGDEMIVDGPTTSKLIYQYPEIVRGIKELSMGLNPQFAYGRVPSVTKEIRTETFTDPVMLSAINKLNENIERGIQAKLIANEDYIDTHKKVIEDHNNFLSKVNG
jgi:hypothetical protein